jgi:hypothetical protein
MDTNATDARVNQYFRRRQLGLQLLAHGARSQTVQSWSGLTRDQLVTLRRRWGSDTQDRRRGPSPSSFEVFFKSSRARHRAALLGSLIRVVGAIPAQRGPRAARELPSLEAGERLCEAYELYRTWDPRSDIDFEQTVLLAIGLTAETTVRLDNCPHCQAAVLVDKLGLSLAACSVCKNRS